MRIGPDRPAHPGRDRRRTDARSVVRRHGTVPALRRPGRVAARTRRCAIDPIGVSMGAATAIDTALEHPELVEALVISGAGPAEPTFDTRGPAILQRADMAIEAMDPQALADRDARIRARSHVHARRRRPHRRHAHPWPRRELRSSTYSSRHRPSDARGERFGTVREIAVPVLGAVGALDGPDHRRMCRRAVESVQDGRGVVSVDGAAHDREPGANAAVGRGSRRFP